MGSYHSGSVVVYKNYLLTLPFLFLSLKMAASKDITEYKLLVIGASNTGKSELISQFIQVQNMNQFYFIVNLWEHAHKYSISSFVPTFFSDKRVCA